MLYINQTSDKYTKLVMKISASGDTTYVQRNASDTHYRAHYGNYVKETGMPDKIYNEEGYIALHGDSVSYHFFERDYLGSVRAVFDLYGNLEQTNDYNVTGIPSSRHLGNADVHKHTGKEFQGFNGLAWYDNNARYYDPILGRFTTQDPLAEKYPWLSPYNHCANNPLKNIDPTGKWLETLYDAGHFVYDVGAALYNHSIGDHETAKSHWIDASYDGLALITPGLPAGMTKVNKIAKATTSQIGKKVHGNSKTSSKAQHAYDIIDTETNKVVKTGVSGGKIRKDGKSVRAESQARKWNKEEKTN